MKVIIAKKKRSPAVNEGGITQAFQVSPARKKTSDSFSGLYSKKEKYVHLLIFFLSVARHVSSFMCKESGRNVNCVKSLREPEAPVRQHRGLGARMTLASGLIHYSQTDYLLFSANGVGARASV